MTFRDVFKNSFLSGYQSALIDAKTIVISLCIAAVLGVYLFFVYKVVTRKTFYNKTFNISLPAMAIITAAIILTIQSNIVLSLGMVGALSIVRFRTAVKDPLDLVFLYWAISVGIISGGGLALIAVVLSLIMTAIIIALQKYPDRKFSKLLLINCVNVESEAEIIQIVQRECARAYKVKSKNMTLGGLDLIIEVKVTEESSLIKNLLKIDGVQSAAILTHDGEITA